MVYFPYFYTMLYAKMFHGYDILKHGNVPVKKTDYYKKRLPESLHGLIVELPAEKKAKKK